MSEEARRAPTLPLGRRVALAVAAAVALVALAGLAAGRDGLVRGALAWKLGRPVSFRRLEVGPGREGTHLVFTDLVLGQPKTFGAGDLARIGVLDLDLRLLPLLAGRLEAPRIALAHARLDLRRKGPGDDNWTLGKKGGGGATAFLAATHTLSIADTRVTMDDPQRHLTLDGTVINDPGDAALPLHLDGGGVLNGAPFTVQARGGPLNARKPGAPHAVHAELVDGRTRVRLVGSSVKPFDFDGFDIDLQASGPNAADLVYLFNFLAPPSPPFTLAGHIRKAGKRLEATGLHGTLGDADMGGTFATVHDGPRRQVQATLHSHRMTAAQLKLMLSEPPPHMTARDTSSGGASAAGKPGSGRLFSDKPFSVARLQKDDVRIDFSADRVDGYAAPVTDLALRLESTQGRVGLSPVRFTVASGRVAGGLVLDTAGRPPRMTVKLTARGLRLASLTAGKGGFGGVLDAHLDAAGRGASPAAAAAAAQGRASVRVTGGALPKKDAAALSGDLFGLIGGALGGGEAPLRCAVADFAIEHGVARAQRLEIAAGSGKALGVGRIDLADETVALRLRASDAGPRPAVQLRAPIYVTGPIAHPKVKAELSEAKLGLGGLFDALARPFKGEAAAVPAPGC